MVANWVKAFWILIGGTVAAAGAAYVGGVFEPLQGSAPIEAAIQQPAAGQTGEGEAAPGTAGTGSETPAGDKKTEAGGQLASLPLAGDQPEAGKPATAEAAPEPEIVVPVFDLVRVEPDGSVVIAGAAAPNSMVEVIAGATVIGTAKAGPTGDFAVVLDEPLKPGDYTVVLRSTSSENLVATSSQTAVIAVPDTESGQVLALVEEPGAPSRLITVPGASEPKQEVAPEEETKVAAKGDRPTAAPSEAPKPGTQAADEPAGETELAGGTAGDGDPVPATEQQAAASESGSETAKPADETPAALRVAVEAVEIEGRTVFVAGHAEAGTMVRVYANDILLGQAVASEAGRFLIEAEKDLPVGDYIVRADMLSADGSEVVARAAVPFEREPGENLAAVAAPQPAEPAKPAVQQADAGAAADAGQTVVARNEEPATSAAEAAPARETASAETETGSGVPATRSEPTVVAGLDGGDTATDAEASDEASRQVASVETEPVEATAPKLQNVGGAVIIRRGDTLWQLSRRVYGRGIRYTTIYLANQDQIADPDMIWPGQVFSVPDETDEGEEADMSAVAEQVAGPSDVSEDVATR